jgi:hypothetical protein
MTITGDGRAFVFLRKHGPLIKQFSNQLVLLTLEGRVFILTFLLYHDYLSKDMFNEIALTQSENQTGYETGKLLRSVCQKWLEDNRGHLDDMTTVVPPTDLCFHEIGYLLLLLIAGQENLECAVEGKLVQ